MIKLANQNRRRATRAQAFVEFAIIIPLLLVTLTAIIEFGYAFFTWAAVGEVARIATRYAVTGNYDLQYCAPAAAFLDAQLVAAGGTAHYATDDLIDGTVDCKVPDFQPGVVPPVKVLGADVTTATLQDFARLPSIQDAGMNGASTGLLYNKSVSGDYMAFLTNPFYQADLNHDATFHTDYRGNSNTKGFIAINICSARKFIRPTDQHTVEFKIDNNNNYDLDNSIATTGDRFLGVCVENDDTPGFIHRIVYTDDPGGPGDRIRVTVTYNHPLIIPFFNAIWPWLKLSTTQDAVVEQFRTSRLAGLAGSISTMAAFTDTPTITLTPTNTLTPTMTNSPTNTSSPTPTPSPTFTLTPSSTPVMCATPNGTGLRGLYYGNRLNGGGTQFTNLIYVTVDPLINFDYGNGAPVGSGLDPDHFEIRWEGVIYAKYPDTYVFSTISDDGIKVWVDNTVVVDRFYDQGPSGSPIAGSSMALSCGTHTVKIDYYENAGGAVAKFYWGIPGFLTNEIVPSRYLYPATGTPPAIAAPTNTPTATYTPTITNTPTITLTPSKTPTSTNTPTKTNTLIPSNTPTVTNTPTKTNTPTNTNTPTITNTPLPATNTPTPTKTLTPTITNTPKPPCVVNPDDPIGCPP